jgi:hypothetical protein
VPKEMLARIPQPMRDEAAIEAANRA